MPIYVLLPTSSLPMAAAAAVCSSVPRAFTSTIRRLDVRAAAISLKWAASTTRPCSKQSTQVGRVHHTPLFFSIQRSRYGDRQSYRHGKRSKRSGETLCSQVELDVNDDEACELVSGVDLTIDVGEDSIDAYLLKAVKNNNGTGILLLSDIFGFEDAATRDFAYRVACNGYNVLVPDLFRGNPWKQGMPIAGNEQWLSSQPAERVAGDIDASTRWLVDGFTAAGVSRRLGAIGFCYGGGGLVKTLARDAGRCFSAGVCFYGTRMDASLGSRINAPVLFVCGDGDPLCPVSTVRRLEKSIRGSKAIVYSGRGHGFAHRPQSPEEDADAEDAFAAMRSWLHDLLLVES